MSKFDRSKSDAAQAKRWSKPSVETVAGVNKTRGGADVRPSEVGPFYTPS